MEMTFQQDLLDEGYLGEVAQRYDDIFNGLTGRTELHLENTDYFRFVQRVTDRSQRRTPATATFNIVGTFSFPNGDVTSLIVEDVFFGELPLNVGSRQDYVQASVNFGASFGRFTGL